MPKPMFGENRLRKHFRLCRHKKNQLDALCYAKSHASRIEAVVTDLRILSGPQQIFYPPTDTPYVYGLKLVQELSLACPKLPVIAYSRFLDTASPTRSAVDEFLLKPPANLLNIYKTPIDPEVAVRHMLYTFLGFDKTSTTTSLADYTRANPAAIIQL